MLEGPDVRVSMQGNLVSIRSIEYDKNSKITQDEDGEEHQKVKVKSRTTP